MSYGIEAGSSQTGQALNDFSGFLPSTSLSGLSAFEDNITHMQNPHQNRRNNSRLYEQGNLSSISVNAQTSSRSAVLEAPFYVGPVSNHGETPSLAVQLPSLNLPNTVNTGRLIEEPMYSVGEFRADAISTDEAVQRSQCLRPSELPYLPLTEVSSALGTGTNPSAPRLTSLFTASHVPSIGTPIRSKIEKVSRSSTVNYVGSSFLSADDVMVVEPILHHQRNSMKKSDTGWPTVALALPTGTGAVPMKAKRGRARAGRFACPECNVVFRQTGNLRKHVAEIHQKSKPFRCGVCGNYFSRKHARDTHLKAVHHKLRPFECSLCFKRYKNRR